MATAEPSKYSTKFYANGGKFSDKTTVYSIGNSYFSGSNTFSEKLSAPTRYGYIFIGWSKTSETETATYTMQSTFNDAGCNSGDVSLYAVWEKKIEKYYIVSSVDLNLVADALTKATSSTVKPSSFPTGYVNAINSIVSNVHYDGDVTVDNLFIDRSIDEIQDETATKLKDYAFAKCTSLTNASFSLVTSVGVNAFMCCTFLTDVQLPKATSIKAGAFSNCTSLTAVVLSNTTQVCSLENINTFANSDSVYIYVPDSLLSDYKADTNWSYYASKIKSLNEY